MAFSISTKPNSTVFLSFLHHHHHLRGLPVSLSLSPPSSLFRRPLLCSAAKSPTGPLEKKPNKKRKKKPKPPLVDGVDVEIVESSAHGVDVDFDVDGPSPSPSPSPSSGYYATPMPKPPSGFVVDDEGRVLMASTNRIATIVGSSTFISVDPTNNFPLECVIRRVFRSSRGDECMLLCPVDTPVQILKSTNIEGWSAVSDEEVEAILPAAAYALAKIHMHLVHNDGQDVDGLPTEGVEITCFHMDGAHYMIYTPSDPLLFVAVKDNNGLLQIADDDLLEDSAIISAIDEETEFNALVRIGLLKLQRAVTAAVKAGMAPPPEQQIMDPELL
ncbi:hypothetical protein L484_027135 [Morus notabilis]|uniref:Uncharacterized protein n=1 Tax=Morus notabilis TaxID=981085 RepID=W9SQ82_9ROSA|nr:hypothetical protein L484_027135 [Morus notabilis]